MIDNKDLEMQASSVPENEIPYRLDDQYTQEELVRLKDFMHADFPHLTYGGGRYKGIIIEYPPHDICPPEEWRQVLDIVLLPEWQELHPALRQRKIIVRFTDKLYDYNNKVQAGGNNLPVGKEYWMRISYKEGDGSIRDIQDCLFILMHELTESDFWVKTLPGDREVADKEEILNAFKTSDHTYRNLLDEKTANRRALRAIRRMWPNIDWADLKYVYEEDR